MNVGSLRPGLISASGGVIQEAVICGHDGDFVTAMVWLHPDHAHRATQGRPDPDLRTELEATLDRLADRGGGSSRRVERLMILGDAAQLDSREITDKGYINQRRVRETRAPLVAELCGSAPSARIVSRR